jgi:hypothetical protein
MAKRDLPVHVHGGDNHRAVGPPGSATMAEYYASMLKNYDKTKLTRKIYAKPTEQLQEWIKSLWHR